MLTVEIIELLNKYKHHSISHTELEQLRSWMEESDDNKRLFNLYIKYYKIVERWDTYQRADATVAFDNVKERRRLKIRRLILRRVSAIAACLLLLIVGTTCLYYYGNRSSSITPYSRLEKTVLLTNANGKQQVLRNGGELVCDTTIDKDAPVQYNTIKTEPGGNFKLILPDHSVVWLNSNTTFRYPTKFVKERRVELIGEAFFDVAHNGLTFMVNAAGNNVQVMGTQFNISAYPMRNMTATLVRGKVKVSNRISNKILTPGQQAVISSPSTTISIREVDTAIYTSWITGVFDFNDAPLQNIMEQLSEWYNMDVVYEPESLRNIHFTGSLYRDKSLDYSLEIVEYVSDVRFRKESGKLIVYKK